MTTIKNVKFTVGGNGGRDDPVNVPGWAVRTNKRRYVTLANDIMKLFRGLPKAHVLSTSNVMHGLRETKGIEPSWSVVHGRLKRLAESNYLRETGDGGFYKK